MDKQILIDLFERRDKKRRRLLYRLYQELIHSDLTAAYIAEIICKQLSSQGLVSGADIKFCRYHFKKRPLKKLPQQTGAAPSRGQGAGPKEHAPFVTLDGAWTDLDSIDLQENLIVKSKFAKKHET